MTACMFAALSRAKEDCTGIIILNVECCMLVLINRSILYSYTVLGVLLLRVHLSFLLLLE